MDPQINLDGSLYHKTCAKCQDCKCQITIANFTKSGDTLLCKTHYFKRFNEQGTYLGGEKFSQQSDRKNVSYQPPQASEATPQSTQQTHSSTVRPAEPAQPQGSVKDRLKMFGGGAGNRTLCAQCNKAVYPNDPQITLDGVVYHKQCAKCIECKCQITIQNFTKDGTTLYCKTHYFKKFREEGTYLGGEKYKSTQNKVGPPKGATVDVVEDTQGDMGVKMVPDTPDTSTEELQVSADKLGKEESSNSSVEMQEESSSTPAADQKEPGTVAPDTVEDTAVSANELISNPVEDNTTTEKEDEGDEETNTADIAKDDLVTGTPELTNMSAGSTEELVTGV